MTGAAAGDPGNAGSPDAPRFRAARAHGSGDHALQVLVSVQDFTTLITWATGLRSSPCSSTSTSGAQPPKSHPTTVEIRIRQVLERA